MWTESKQSCGRRDGGPKVRGNHDQEPVGVPHEKITTTYRDYWKELSEFVMKHSQGREDRKRGV